MFAAEVEFVKSIRLVFQNLSQTGKEPVPGWSSSSGPRMRVFAVRRRSSPTSSMCIPYVWSYLVNSESFLREVVKYWARGISERGPFSTTRAWEKFLIIYLSNAERMFGFLFSNSRLSINTSGLISIYARHEIFAILLFSDEWNENKYPSEYVNINF